MTRKRSGNVKNDILDAKRIVVNELHKPARKTFQTRKVIIKGLWDTFQADLVEMIPYAKINSGYKYILVVINVFSKFVWALPVKNKSANEVTKAMEKILQLAKKYPKNIQTDLGKEFYNSSFEKLMKKYNINHYSTYSSKKASIVERVNRTLKSMMWKEFSYQGSYKWLKLLPIIVDKYNATVHSTIGMKPNSVNEKNEKRLLKNVYSHIKTVNLHNIKFKVGDSVRISKVRSQFAKGYTPNYTNEIFKISKVKLTNPITYELLDANNHPIKGAFYKEELQKCKFSDVYLVEKILKRKNNKLFVKWLGLDSTHNSWVNKNNIV